MSTAEPVSATALELQKVADEARRYAGFYSEATDGRNTFIIFAEWVERRLSALSHVQAPIGSDGITDEMLNEGQERLCQIASRTNFDDYIQAEIYKAMRAVDPLFKAVKS